MGKCFYCGKERFDASGKLVHDWTDCVEKMAKDLSAANQRADKAQQDLAAEREAHAQTRNESKRWNEIASEYSGCLQKLCMETLYETCAPISYKWPGTKHVSSIVEAVEFLIKRAERAEQQLAAAVARADKAADELADLKHTFDLQWSRMGEAVELWRKANPGNEMVRPDLGELLKWFMAELARVRGLLREFEWSSVHYETDDDPSPKPECPHCFGLKRDGHKPGCLLQQALAQPAPTKETK